MHTQKYIVMYVVIAVFRASIISLVVHFLALEFPTDAISVQDPDSFAVLVKARKLTFL